jgi:hypothetical protein
MEINQKFLAPCGLYCGVCGVYYATRDNNEKFITKLIDLYQSNIPNLPRLTSESIHCQGCLSDHPSFFCSHCQIKDCTKAKGYQGCHQCHEFPCQFIEQFPMPVGKKVILRAIPYWREQGTEKWVEDEIARYHCPQCGHEVFRGAKRCNQCKTALDLD